MNTKSVETLDAVRDQRIVPSGSGAMVATNTVATGVEYRPATKEVMPKGSSKFVQIFCETKSLLVLFFITKFTVGGRTRNSFFTVFSARNVLEESDNGISKRDREKIRRNSRNWLS